MLSPPIIIGICNCMVHQIVNILGPTTLKTGLTSWKEHGLLASSDFLKGLRSELKYFGKRPTEAPAVSDIVA